MLEVPSSSDVRGCSLTVISQFCLVGEKQKKSGTKSIYKISPVPLVDCYSTILDSGLSSCIFSYHKIVISSLSRPVLGRTIHSVIKVHDSAVLLLHNSFSNTLFCVLVFMYNKVQTGTIVLYLQDSNFPRAHHYQLYLFCLY